MNPGDLIPKEAAMANQPRRDACTWLDLVFIPAFVAFCLLGKWLEIDE